MPNARFVDLQQTLIRHGVAPLYVQRTLLELNEHFEDLESAALCAGVSAEEAERFALAQLGNEQTIASMILAHPELRAWTHRWPRAGAFVKAAVFVATIPEAPLLYCIGRGPDIARWSVAVGAALLLVGSLLAGLNFMIVP